MSLIVAILFSIFCCLSASAADVGTFCRAGTSSITSPVNGKTWVFDSNTLQLWVYNNNGWERKLLPKVNLFANANPSASDDSASGYAPGAIWVNDSTKKVFLCGDAAVGAAIWHEISNRISAQDVLNKLTTSDVISDHVVSGLLASTATGLASTTSAGVAYVSGSRVVTSAVAHTYTASRDTYEYLQADGFINRVEVPNSDPAPSGQAGLAIQKVVTSSTDVVSVSQLALTSPRVKASAAQANNEAVSLGQGDGRYAPISIFQSGTPYQAYVRDSSGNAGFVSLTNSYLPVLSLAKGGTNNAALTANNLGLYYGNGSQIVQLAAPGAGLYKLRSNSANSAFEFVPDTSGTVTSVNASFTGLPWLAAGSAVTSSGNIAFSPLCAKGDLIVGDAANSTSVLNVGSNGLPLVANSGTGHGLGYAVLGLAGGGTNNGSLAATQWSIPYFDGTKMANSPVLAANQSWRLNGSGTALEAFTPAAGTSNILGGDGSSGAVTKGTTSVSLTQINATTFSQTASTTTTWAPGCIINATGTATFSGTSTVTDLGNGAAIARSIYYNGIGSFGGNGWSSTIGSTYYGGGGGGGFGGAGGQGGNDGNALVTGGSGGKAEPVTAFAHGGGGGSSQDAVGGGRGGNLRVCAGGAITVANGGSITANGANGANSATGGGAGGGSGGYLGLYSKTSITLSTGSSVTANGGTGGSAVNASHGKGGGGGAGVVVIFSPSNTLTVAPVVNGGAMGATGISTGGSAGSSGIVSQTNDVPNLPIIAHIEKTPVIMAQAVLWRFRTGDYTGTARISPTHKQLADACAAFAAKPGEFYALKTALLYGASEQEIAKLSVIDCKGFGDKAENLQCGNVVMFTDTEKSETLENAA